MLGHAMMFFARQMAAKHGGQLPPDCLMATLEHYLSMAQRFMEQTLMESSA